MGKTQETIKSTKKIKDPIETVKNQKANIDRSVSQKRVARNNSMSDTASIRSEGSTSSIRGKKFWTLNNQVLPRLCDLVLKINIIMSTSCAAESAFSIAGYIDRKSRARLSSKTLRFSILSKEEEIIYNMKQELYEN